MVSISMYFNEHVDQALTVHTTLLIMTHLNRETTTNDSFETFGRNQFFSNWVDCPDNELELPLL